MDDEDNEITTEVQNTKDTQEDLKLIISDLKKGKRNAKSLLTRLLTQLVGLLSLPEEIEHNRRQVYELLQRIDEQQQAVLDIMDDLETAFRKMDDSVNATKTTDEAEKIEQQVEGETVVARQLLASLAKKQAYVNSVNSGQVSVEAENTKQLIRFWKRTGRIANRLVHPMNYTKITLDILQRMTATHRTVKSEMLQKVLQYWEISVVILSNRTRVPPRNQETPHQIHLIPHHIPRQRN